MCWTAVTDPENPIVLAFMPQTGGTRVIWADMKVYSNHVYIIRESSNHGMQVSAPRHQRRRRRRRRRSLLGSACDKPRRPQSARALRPATLLRTPPVARGCMWRF